MGRLQSQAPELHSIAEHLEYPFDASRKPELEPKGQRSDESDLEDYHSPRGRSRRRHRRDRLLRAKIRSLRQHSRMYVGCLRVLVFFISGFLFALIIVPLSSSGDSFDDAFRNFDTTSIISPHDPEYPSEFMKGVLPIQCHSHNDYARQRPLYSALASGCISVEADVWDVNNDLYVAHTRGEVVSDRTLRSLYLNPILELLNFMNSNREPGTPMRGVFYQKPSQTLVLIIDLKRPEIWPLMQKQLQPLREKGYLTFWDGQDRHERPLTIVGSGSTPFNLLISNTTYRDIFYDAPLDALDGMLELDWPPHEPIKDHWWSKYNTTNSYYASSSLSRAVGSVMGFKFSDAQLELIRHQVREAQNRGLVARYWGTPRWPRGLRDEVWGALLQAEVGVINVDDLRSARKGHWGTWPRNGQHKMFDFDE